MIILVKKDRRMAVMMEGETYFQQRQRNSPGLVPVISSMSLAGVNIL